MNTRIRRLRDQSVKAHPTLDPERARLLTAFMKESHDGPAPLRRARALEYILSNKSICIVPGELIVGERGPAPKATSTYPEICIHSLEDLEVLDTRQKIPFTVSEETKQIYRDELIPFWRGRSMRDQIFRSMTRSWKDAYEAGIFTEFMEQRAPGHTVLDDKIYRKGFLDFLDDIRRHTDRIEGKTGRQWEARRNQLEAMAIVARALVTYARRHAALAKRLAEAEADPIRRNELERIADICEHVPGRPPRDFWEALQYYWFVHLGVIIEYNTWDAFNPGRLDQHLLPFYERGIEDGSLTREKAKELLQAFWIKFNNQPAPPKVGVTAEESGTYTDFALINTGGLRPDGTDGVNEVSYLILDVVEEMRILQPSSMVQISGKTPPEFLRRALEIVRTGFGQPSIFNADAIVEELLRRGTSREDALAGGASGCVETGAFGKENYMLTGYFNLPKVLEVTLHNGRDPATGKRIGPETGDMTGFGSFDELMDAFDTQLGHFVDIKVEGNTVVERLYAEHLPAPLLSILIDDCIETGTDYHAGGARYNTSYIQGVGLGTTTDTLTSIRHNIFDTKRLTAGELFEALVNNFENASRCRMMLINKTPKYGNDDDGADDVMRRIFELYLAAVDGRPNARGGRYRINLLPTTVHIYFGRKVGATADGRRAHEPLSEGISPVQGADRHGPTAVIRSAAKLDHLRTGGTLLNQKFTPHLLSDPEGMDKLTALVRTYFRMNGHHIQFNVVSAETLREAQRNPEKHRDLIVRVAGYSDYFVDLSPELQNEIIMRTEHASFGR